MAIWKPYKPYKAKPHERKKRRVQQPFPDLCRICGKPLKNGSDMCRSCRKFINYKKAEERKQKK